MKEKALTLKSKHLREFREFAAEHFTQSNWSQKILSRVFKKLSIDIITNQIRLITNE